MGSDANSADDILGTVLPELIRNQRLMVLAPNGTVNAGVVKGDQRTVLSTSSIADDGAVTPWRQGPVRPRDLQIARQRFVSTAGFERGLAALDSGILLLVGVPGTGRLTLALNLLAHGCEDPTLVQVDGTVDLARWRPRPQGVDGYLVMEPGDPFALRPWDLSSLEGSLAEAGARLVIVLPETPGLVRTLERDFGAQVVRHEPPDPGHVFSSHLADICQDAQDRARLLELLGPEFLSEILPPELPPGYAAQAAATVARLGATGGMCRSEVMGCLASAEAPELLARAEGDPELLAHLMSVCVYGGLDRGTVVEQAVSLLALADSRGDSVSPDHALRDSAAKRGHSRARQRPLHDILRGIGARCEARTHGKPESVAFLWPAVREAVWDVMCRDRTGLLPLLHEWLGRPGHDEETIERAGRAVAAMGIRSGGRTFGLVRELALSTQQPGVRVAAWSIGTATHDRAVSDTAYELLEEWSAAPETALRTAVAYACRSDMGGVKAEHALPLLQHVVDGRGNDADDVAVALTVAETLLQQFATGSPADKGTIVRHMNSWAQAEGVAGLLAAITFPTLVDCDHGWFSDQLLARQETASNTVKLVQHALGEAAAYHPMRDALLAWCRGTDDTPQPDAAVEDLFARLVDTRQPGFLRLLLSIERGGDAMPGKGLAARSLAAWRSRNQPRESE
ncbi:hypothetical protein ACWCV5_03000 [Streptomyces tubercidicus]